ncbi:MAG: UDP-N-acetylglucosamine 2-epimerase [Bryobacterales bacterium]
MFGIAPDFDLGVMDPGQSLTAGAARMLSGLDAVIGQTKPDAIVVQGDTTSTFCGALANTGACRWRTWGGAAHGRPGRPFPEEAHRVMAGRIARWHFAATRAAAANLWQEGVEHERVFVTGNTGVDALLEVRKRLFAQDPPPNGGKRLVVVTAHRREARARGARPSLRQSDGWLPEETSKSFVFCIQPRSRGGDAP